MRKLSHNSITLLVLGCISVAIERPFIPADWEYDLNVSEPNYRMQTHAI